MQINGTTVKDALLRCIRTFEANLDKCVPDITADILKRMERNGTNKTTVDIKAVCNLVCDQADGIKSKVKPDWPRPKLGDFDQAGNSIDGGRLSTDCPKCDGSGCDDCNDGKVYPLEDTAEDA